MKIINIASARPNFMKVAPLLEEYKNHNSINVQLLHTGQHYDYEMSKIFFDELGIPEPDFHLEVGSGSHAEQTARVMTEFEKVLDKEQPDWVIVVGDVNPTMACTIVAVKKGIKVAHVEAGLRSHDRSMPEEINRILTDSIADLLLTPSIDGNTNLAREGIPEQKIRFVGNIMIDTLFMMREKASASEILSELDILGKDYVLITLHRPSNVDNYEVYNGLIDVMEELSQDLQLVWPMHPRSRKQAEEFDLLSQLENMKGLHILEPTGYTDTIHLMENSAFVMTDSGGIQEETTALGIPCLTVRENTERPITITEGTNRLAGTNPETILSLAQEVKKTTVNNRPKKPLYWDGKTAGRIVKALLEYK